MAAGKSRPKRASALTKTQKKPLGSASFAERVQAEREQLFKVIGIVELCRLATATTLDITDPEYLIPAFETICDQLNASAERLEWLTADLQKLSGKAKP